MNGITLFIDKINVSNIDYSLISDITYINILNAVFYHSQRNLQTYLSSSIILFSTCQLVGFINYFNVLGYVAISELC